MQRYQIYLEPETMEYLKNIAEQAGVSRSRIIQEMTESFVQRYIEATKVQLPQEGSILDFAGILKTGKKMTHSSNKPDSDYFGR